MRASPVSRSRWIEMFGPEEIARLGLAVVPCACADDPCCKGWQVVYPNRLPEHATGVRVIVPGDVLEDLITDRLGICLACGALDDPVPVDAVRLPCDVCTDGSQMRVGINVALMLGAIVVDSAPGA